MKNLLFKAVSDNNIDLVKRICIDEFNEEYWDYWKPSPEYGDLSGALEKAVENQNVEIVKILLKSDDDRINFVKYNHIIDSLKIAYRLPNLLLCDLLWDFLDDRQWGIAADTIAFCLGRATFSGEIKAIDNILNKGGIINCLTGWSSPLTIAVSNNNLDLVKLLIERGADPNFNNREENAGCGPLATAAINNFIEIYQYLLPLVSDRDEIEFSELYLNNSKSSY